VSARYTIPRALAASEHHDAVVAKLDEALAAVVLEHPALRVKAVGEDRKRPAWAPVESVDFARHVEWRDVDDDATRGDYYGFFRDVLEKRVDEEHSTLEGRPKWRVLFLFFFEAGKIGEKSKRPFVDVVFEFNHGFMDGMSGKIFHETLLRRLNNTTTPAATRARAQPILEHGVLTIPSTASSLPPPAERVGKIAITPKFAVSSAWKELRPPALASKSASRARWAPIQPTPFKTQFRMFDIPAETLQNVLAACRAHKTTLTGLLHAIVVFSMATHIPPSQATAFANDTALNLRRHLPSHPRIHPTLEPARTMSNYVSLMGHKFDADLVHKIRETRMAGAISAPASKVSGEENLPAGLVDLLWQCAARVRAEIQHRLDMGLKNEIVGLMHLVSDWRAQLREDALKPRQYSCVVTNLGAFDAATVASPMPGEKDTDQNYKEGGSAEAESGPDSDWEVQHSAFALSTEVCGAAFQVSTISVKGKALCVGCSWQDCVVDLKLGETMVAELERWLRFLGKHE